MSDQQHTFTFRATAEGVEQAKSALNNMGVVVSQVDKLIGESKTSWEKMRRNYVDGAKDVFEAQKAFTSLNQAVLDGKARGSELAQVYTGITQKVGQAAAQAAIATGEFGALSNAIKSIDISSANNAKAKLASDWEGIIAVESFAQKDRISQTKVQAATNWEAQLISDEFGAKEAKAKLASDWEGIIAVESFAQKERTSKAIAAAKAEHDAVQAQYEINSRFGIGSTSKSARDSAATFQEYFDAKDDSKKKTAALEQEARAAKQALAAYDPLVQAKLSIAKAQEVLTAAVARGDITQERSTQLMAAHTRSVMMDANAKDKALVTTDKLNMSHNKMLMLNAAAINSFQALASGMSVSRVAMMESAQVVGAFIQESAGLSAVLKAAFTPVGAAIASVAAVTVGAVVSYQSYAASIRDVSNANTVMGQTTGLTRSELESLADATSKNGLISRSTAREVEVAFIRTGKVTGDNLKSAMAIVEDFAKATGTDAPEAAKALASALSDPARGAAELDKQFHILSASQLNYVNRLFDQGDSTKAMTFLIDKLTDRMKDHAINGIGSIEYGWKGALRAAENYFDNIGNKIAGVMGFAPPIARQQRIGEINDLVNKGRTIGGVQFRLSDNDAAKLISERDKLISEEAAEKEAARAREIKQAKEDRIKSSHDLAKAAGTEAEAFRKLDDEHEKYKKAISDLAGQSGSHVDTIIEAANKVDHAIKTRITEAGRISQAADINRRYSGQFGQDADISKLKEEVGLSLRGQAVTDAVADATKIAAVTNKIAEFDAQLTIAINRMAMTEGNINELADAYDGSIISIHEAELKARILNDTFGMSAERADELSKSIIAVDIATRRLSVSEKMFNLREQARDVVELANAWKYGAEEARKAEIESKVRAESRSLKLDMSTPEGKKAAGDIRDKYYEIDMNKRLSDVRQIADKQKEELETARLELSLAFESDNVLSQELAKRAKIVELKSNGANFSLEETQAIIRNAAELEKTKQITSEIRDVSRQFSSTITSGIMDVVKGTHSWREALSGVVGKMGEILAQKALMTATDNALSGLFKFGGGLFGGGSGDGVSLASIAQGAALANGGVVDRAGITPFANGGIVSRPTVFPFAKGIGLMGEAGPEAIIPLSRGPGGKLGVRSYGGGGGGAVILNTSINVQAGSGTGDESKDKMLAERISAQMQSQFREFVVAEMRNQSRPGGLFNAAHRVS